MKIVNEVVFEQSEVKNIIGLINNALLRIYDLPNHIENDFYKSEIREAHSLLCDVLVMLGEII